MQDEGGARGATCVRRFVKLRSRPHARDNGRTRCSLRCKQLKTVHPCGDNWPWRADGADFTTIPCCLSPSGSSLKGFGATSLRACYLMFPIIHEDRNVSRIVRISAACVSTLYSISRRCGNKITSRILGLSAISMVNRSTPMPKPPVGGMP